MKSFVDLIVLLLKWFGVYKHKKEQKEKQESRNALEENPHKWFLDKYGSKSKPDGVRDLRDNPDADESDTKPDKS